MNWERMIHTKANKKNVTNAIVNFAALVIFGILTSIDIYILHYRLRFRIGFTVSHRISGHDHTDFSPGIKYRHFALGELDSDY
jgi:hypothetical protein